MLITCQMLNMRMIFFFFFFIVSRCCIRLPVFNLYLLQTC